MATDTCEHLAAGPFSLSLSLSHSHTHRNGISRLQAAQNHMCIFVGGYSESWWFSMVIITLCRLPFVSHPLMCSLTKFFPCPGDHLVTLNQRQGLKSYCLSAAVDTRGGNDKAGRGIESYLMKLTWPRCGIHIFLSLRELARLIGRTPMWLMSCAPVAAL